VDDEASPLVEVVVGAVSKTFAPSFAVLSRDKSSILTQLLGVVLMRLGREGKIKRNKRERVPDTSPSFVLFPILPTTLIFAANTWADTWEDQDNAGNPVGDLAPSVRALHMRAVRSEARGS
jgi:hypothetical protein